MGTIQARTRQLDTIRYQATIRIKGFPTLSRAFPSRTEAEAWLAEHEASIHRRIHSAKIEAERQRIAAECSVQYRTLGDLMRRYLATVTPSKRSADQETIRMNGLLKHGIADCPIVNLDRQRVAEWRDARLQNVTGPTVRRDMILLAHVVKIGMVEWNTPLVENPFRTVRRPLEGPPRNRRMKSGEEPALLSVCDDARAPYLRPIVELALETALRQSELVQLDWSNVSMSGRYAYLPMTKSGTARGIPLSSRAVEILADLPAALDSDGNRAGPVFVGATSEAVKRAFIRASRRAGLANFRFHDLRHEATSRFFERGLTVPEVARITGHKTWTMLERYTHLQLADVARRLDGPKNPDMNAPMIEQLARKLRRLLANADRSLPAPDSQNE
ncbi:site-specific integrase [Burkholderia multivorans]|uniref:integrase n=1 Tax=Burkholderia multivorans TaxID=87883 RepID=UPI000277C90D|nr:site-specific integrase [Burkholderia multivorans]AJY19405.1 phage integrase family protein [Burkholderia multivorans ATCC BAA-247]AVR21828.1 site-specific integrase [Burkholderia multivorans]EJO63209.1 site-specific recombinase, phage integrase family [Burkholderia multivorans ATCC BAA-247]MBU9311646.1 site-specific integrase [Burkholderia multivorans]MBU9334114.1 site-specific integrase [Burkholderia multivorans]